jgi:hypothetical protein
MSTGALVACWDCGFVTRRHSRIGIGGECPHCRRELAPINLSTARALQVRRRERARAGTSTPPLGTDPSMESPWR